MAREVDTADSKLGTNEEEKMYELERYSDAYISVYNKIPYKLIREEMDVDPTSFEKELGEICGYYKIYKAGKLFITEGTNGDYVPAQLKYKMCANLINKEARFLFAEEPDINIVPKDNGGTKGEQSEEEQKNLTILKNLVDTVLDKNNFEDILLKAARDCFIGKRVAGLINFNEEDGVTFTFLPSTQFLFETKMGNPNVLTKFVSFVAVVDCTSNVDKRIFKKKFTLEEEGEGDNHKHVVYLDETLYDGNCNVIERITTHEKLEIDFIPAVIFINDGLSGETKGESEVDLLKDYELWYSKLANADTDAERKSMNPTKYVVDMDNTSTKDLSTAAGAFWDLGSDQNLENAKVMVGLLEPEMNYSPALKTTLDRIKTTGYEQVDVPNITLDSMMNTITTGKALKAIYWPLIIRCKEKMKVWGPQLQNMIEMLIEGGKAYPNCISYYIDGKIPNIEYKVEVIQNTPLPEDELEEKTSDLAEVETQTMSRKSYMQKWRRLTDAQAQQELEQIAYEAQLFEEATFEPDGKMIGFGEEEKEEEDLFDEDITEQSERMVSRFNGDNKASNIVKNADFSVAGKTTFKGDETKQRSGSTSDNKTWGQDKK